jgi:diaminopimelate epimerase
VRKPELNRGEFSVTWIPFIKMHGCGNDYVYLDCFENPVPENPGNIAALLSDRHRSIGADGLVLMLPGDVPGAAGRMRMFNADGSEGSLCGNALRCMAMWLYQTDRCETEFQIAMADRMIDAAILSSDPHRRRATVTVTLGEPVRVSTLASGLAAFVKTAALEDVTIPQLTSSALHVSMGNPHTVLFVDSLSDVNFAVLGPLIEHHSEFPNRTNVEFVEVTGPASARVRVWERGSGETLACGSGACAVAVAGISCSKFGNAQQITVAMAGGDLQVLWDSANRLHLTGPAEESFRGVVEI